MYPNQFANKIIINQPIHKNDIQFLNMLGQDMSNLFSVIGNGQKTEIITDDLPSGVYVIKIIDFYYVLMKL